MIPKNQVSVTASMRIISTAKGKPLIPVETFTYIVNIMAGIAYPDNVLQALCDSETRLAFVELIRERLKKDVELKRFLGATKWSADVVELEFTRLKEELHA